MVKQIHYSEALKIPMVDVDVSYPEHTAIWSLRRSELAAWTLFVFLVGIVPLVGRRNVSAAAVVDVRMQPIDSGPHANGTKLTPTPGSGWRLDINTARESELELLPGIGATRARAIIKEREKRGAFHTIWELSDVPGVTKALVQRLEPLLRAEPLRR